ncbi:MAG: LamG domain-containing protein [Bacteroidales bacterium]|nr:LamG domain-containing protein [Bacteroidales bacterium]
MKKIICIILSVILPLILLSQKKSNTFKLIENAYINISSINLEPENQFTVMGWIKWESNTIGEISWSSIVAENNHKDDEEIQFIIQKNSNCSQLEFGLKFKSGFNNTYSDRPMKEGEWFHFAAICNGNQQKLYINGVEVSGKMSTGRSNSFEPDFIISLSSMAAWNFAQNFDGEVDNVSVWEHALTQEEILNRMTDVTLVHNVGLISYYSDDEPDNNTLLNKNIYNHINIRDDNFIINPSIIADKSIDYTEESNNIPNRQ